MQRSEGLDRLAMVSPNSKSMNCQLSNLSIYCTYLHVTNMGMAWPSSTCLPELLSLFVLQANCNPWSEAQGQASWL